jgi:SAM-dependent methyltransferase
MFETAVMRRAIVRAIGAGVCVVLLAGCSPEESRVETTRGGHEAQPASEIIGESEAARFDHFAREVFKNVYRSLAEQILGDYGVRDGLCLDLGCGPGYLGIELAERSNLRVIGVDIDPNAVLIARANISRRNLGTRVTAEEGDVHKLRFADGSADLIVSRGSFAFWDHPAKAFREIQRVLKPSGVAFIGGGMGRSITPEERAAIKKRLEEVKFQNGIKRVITPVMMQEILESASIAHYRIMSDGPGDSGCKCAMWVEIRPPPS